jgi:CubicO group peptidase (beta-lactamase class C family)
VKPLATAFAWASALLFAALLPGVAFAQPAPRLAPAQAIPPDQLAPFIDALVESQMARDHVAGATVSVVQDGKLVFKRGYGFASLTPRRPVDADATMFRLGSISKTFTWIMLMQEVEAGRMDLQAPVDTYLPLPLRSGPGKFGKPIRLVDLMDHSPGFEDKIFGVLFKRDLAKVQPLDTWLATTRPERVRPPGLVSSYSNYGASLAGAALAHETGRDYETLVDQRILGPLGLTHSTFREPHPGRPDLPGPMPAGLLPNSAAGFHWTGTAYAQRGFEYNSPVAPAGGLSASAADMSRYMQMILNGGALDGTAIYGPKAAEAFRTPVRPAPEGLAWRHGFYDKPLPGGLVGFGHSGGTVSFSSDMTLVPALRLGVFISTNTDTGGRLSGGLAPALVDNFYAPPAAYPPAPNPKLAGMAAAFSGHYLSTRRRYSGLEGFVHRIAFGQDITVTPDGYLVLKALIGFPGSFVPVGDPAAGRFVPVEGGFPLTFSMSGGRATGILTGGATLERTGALDAAGPITLAAILTALASAATLIGLVLRPRGEPAGRGQRIGGWLQVLQAGLWLGAGFAFLQYMQFASNIGEVEYVWPHPAMITASALGLAAAIATAISLPLLVPVWREAGWGWRRRAGYTATALFALALALLLARWGFLLPWTS